MKLSPKAKRMAESILEGLDIGNCELEGTQAHGNASSPSHARKVVDDFMDLSISEEEIHSLLGGQAQPALGGVEHGALGIESGMLRGRDKKSKKKQGFGIGGNDLEGDVRAFLYYMMHHRSLTRRQVAKRDALLVRDVSGRIASPVNEPDITQEKPRGKEFKPLQAFSAAKYLSMFNKPLELKYLTHDFDYGYDGRPNTIEELIAVANGKVYAKGVPSSLVKLVKGFVTDGHWIDTYGNKHVSCICDPDWVSWNEEKGSHPIANPEYCNEIMAFGSTIRVRGNLGDICDKASEGLSISITKDGLDAADFYTNTYMLFLALKTVFRTMDVRARQCPKVSVSTEGDVNGEGQMLRRVIITQYGSFSKNTIEDVMNRLERNPEAGDFGSIRDKLNGYCLWQVETLWNDEPYRWNILGSPEMDRSEKIGRETIMGFTHIFTFYLL